MLVRSNSATTDTADGDDLDVIDETTNELASTLQLTPDTDEHAGSAYVPFPPRAPGSMR